MALKIKLTRIGRTDIPFYRIIVAEQRSKRDGKVVDNLGYVDPTKNPPLVKADGKKLNYWITMGATPTASVKKLIDYDKAT